jgi:predicted enzyme related to lactoylglutathione lyase
MNATRHALDSLGRGGTLGPMTIKKIAFTLYPVRDIARARRFYEQDLGLVKTGEFVGGRWIEYDLAGGCFALTDLVDDLQPSASAGGSIAFEVDDVDGLVATLRGKGVTVKAEPFSSPVCRMAVILDSEGNALTLHQVT